MRTLTPSEDLAQLAQSSPVLLVQFGTGTCMPCKAIRQKLAQWAADRPGVQCVYVPLEDFPQLAAQESIFTVPTVVVYADGRPALRESGCFSLQELCTRVDRYLALLA